MNPSARGVRTPFALKFLPFLAVLASLLCLQTSAFAADGAAPGNTIVRFDFQRGTNALGVVDVELFDQEKPETVRNFLLYVRSGAYSNIFMHRLVPNFVVQGGGFASTNPASAERFSTFLTVTNFGQVTNEFNVGARMSNVVGTLAMAKLGNDPNSASSQWFFNLTNNTSNLDNQNGGFTVFGRVLDSSATNEGLNVLKHFNTLSTNAGIVNLNNLLGTNYAVFNSLPVAYTNSITRVPNNRELYFVNISLLNNTKPAGSVEPSIAITSPFPNSAFTNDTVRIRGTASDDVEVARIVYRVGEGAWQGGSGTTNWEVAIDPQPGFQTVTVASIDWEGNFSAPESINLFFRRTIPLQLQIVGDGTVSGLVNGQILNANEQYTATATPASGSIFESWSGSVTSSTPTLTFTAPAAGTNFTLTAKFIKEPLPTLTGTYHGLFQTLGAPDFDGAGFMTLQLDADGSARGDITYHGIIYHYTARFDASGNTAINGPIGGIQRNITLSLQKLNSSGLITGTFSGTSSTTLIQLERIATALPATDAPTAGKYTFVIPLNATNTPSSTAPGGHGFGSGTITSAGAFNLSGTLGDGSTFTATPQITRLGRWPLYVDLDSGRGVLFGWISYATNPTPKLTSSLTWIRTPNGSAQYPAGLTNQVNFAASKSDIVNGQRALNFVHGLVKLAGTDLPPNFTNVVKLSTDNVLTVLDPNPNKLKLTLDKTSGLVTGSFVNPFFATTNTIKGAMLTASNYIRGQYSSGSQVGNMSIDIAPFLVAQPVQNVTLAGLQTAMNEGGILQFQGDGVITLTAPLVPKFDTRLDANGHSITISGGGSTRLVEVPTNISFAAVGVIFANGYHKGANGVSGGAPTSAGDGFGGGIMSFGGSVALTNCVVTNCFAIGGDAGADTSANSAPTAGGDGLGAALYSKGGGITLNNCTIANNRATAGGNRTLGTSGSAISQGYAMGMGAGLFSEIGDVKIVNSTFANNAAEGGEPLAISTSVTGRAGNSAGGAISVIGGALTLSNTKFFTNSASAAVAAASGGSGHAYAGAVYLETNVVATIDKGVFVANAARAGKFTQTGEAANAEGGAIYSAGTTVTVKDSSFEQNTALAGATSPAGYARGGAISSGSALVISTSLFADNVAQGGEYEDAATTAIAGGDGIGGAIFSLNSLTATNSTFAFNHAIGGSGADPVGQTNAQRGFGRGGAIAITTSAATLVNLTLANNDATAGAVGAADTGGAIAGGILNDGGTYNLRASIVASNAPVNFVGALEDLGYNISSDASFNLTTAGSLTNKDPVISLLATNGGPTRTIAILPTSPARDAVRGAFPATDQRGTARPQGSFADSGAYEFVQTVPIFTLQPSGTNTVRLGTNVTLQAEAAGPAPLGYYWIKDGAQITGANSASLTITNVQPLDAGKYAAVATNAFGSTTSTEVTLVVDLKPVIITNPSDVVISPGNSTSLVVNAVGPDLTYTWLRNDAVIAGATSATLPLAANPGADGTYKVVVSNPAGTVTSLPAVVTWSASALTILAQPETQTVALNSFAKLTVLASGITPIEYQWFKDNAAITGETNNTLTFESVVRTNAATYRVIVRNAFVTINSSNAVLSVTPPPLLSVSGQGTPNFAITVFGDPGRTYRLFNSTNLAQGSVWTQVGAQTLPGTGTATWSITTTTNSGGSYFRVLTP